jgi:hypothetical protein
MTEDQIKYMAARFCGWKLPDNFNPDNGITFERFGNKGTPFQFERDPSGTNLLCFEQAKEMVKYLIEGMPKSAHEAEIRNQALEEAAQFLIDNECNYADAYVEAIRSLKSKAENL